MSAFRPKAEPHLGFFLIVANDLRNKTDAGQHRLPIDVHHRAIDVTCLP